MKTALFYFLYAAIVLAGGALGYARAKSSASLISSVVFAVLIAAGGVLLILGHPRSGLALGILSAIALTGFFLPRYVKTRKPMPAIPMIALSVIALAVSILRLIHK
jgi:uncharacterized membrane protein (UPF0136 family)